MPSALFARFGRPGLAMIGAIRLLLVMISVPVSAAIYTVGGDADCDFDNIQIALLNALVNPGHDTIRIATNATWNAQALVVENQDVTLAGGFANCLATAPATNAFTTLNGAGGATAPVIRINNFTTTRRQVVLRDLRITGGEVSGVRVGDDVLVLTERVNISGNQATNGGGLYVDGTDGATVVLDDRSRASSNEATTNGGGIYCTGPGLVGMRGNIRQNVTGQFGGGIYATNGCQVIVFSNNLPPAAPPGISANRAGLEGGGVHASGGAVVNLLGTVDRSLSISDNRALNGSGGGIRALGTGTQIVLSDASVIGNLAVRRGGGIAVSSNARLEFHRTNACPRGQNCATLINNQATGPIGVSDNNGGALAVWSGAHAALFRVDLHSNSAADRGALAWVDGSGSLFEMEGSVIGSSSGGRPRIEAENGAIAQIVYSTFSNSISAGHTLLQARNGALVRLYSSLVAGQAGSVFDITGGGQGDADCVIAHETVSMPPSATRIGPATPGSALLLTSHHLRPDSPAIDFCDIGVVPPSTLDIDGDVRGFDSPSHPNLYGTFDLGADEYTGPGDAIFADRFRSH
jgi:hypothetical protein